MKFRPFHWFCYWRHVLSVAVMISACTHASLVFAKQKSDVSQLQGGLEKPYMAPGFVGIDAWLNSSPLTMESLKGKVVLVDFWTYSCINCVRTLPHLIDWDRKYRRDGLVIIGVHSPEFEFEKNKSNVEAAIKRYGIKYPVAMDNQLATWNNFHNEFWPAHYLIDREGRVVYTHFGEGAYATTENNIRHLLGMERLGRKAAPEKLPYDQGQTQETYLGYDRAHEYGGSVLPVLDKESDYSFPDDLPKDSWALAGKWKIEADKTVSSSDQASLRLNFKARKVFLVMGTDDGNPRSVQVRLDGKSPGQSAGKDAMGGQLRVKGNTLYELIDQKKAKRALLEITADRPGLEVYAFTFGS